MKILLRDSNNIVFFDNLDPQCFSCEEQCNSDGTIFKCPIYTGDEFRQGKKINSSGAFFLCCQRLEAKTTKLFKEKLEILIYSMPTLKKVKEDIFHKTKRTEQEKYEKIVHNLRTINAQSIQEQFSLIRQDLLADNYSDQVQFVTDEIKKNPEKAAIVFLRLAKNNAGIKTEFVTHEKLSVENPTLSISNHDIKKVILNVYHAFSLELKSKKVTMDIFQIKKKILFDYDTIRLAFYHLFHNAAKYIKPNSIFKIDFLEIDGVPTVIFKMDSIHIMDNELNRIFDDNYSGVKVKEINSQGGGLGMGLIKKALELNNATIEIIAGKNIEKKNKFEYSKNEFIMMFKNH